MNSVKIKQTFIDIPTYKWGKEDAEPPLIRGFTPRTQPIYPYTTQEIISDKKSLCRYKAVILENEYLKLTFLPELNGRLYSAFDKVNRKEMFYSNEVIKPALFGLRGVWSAVGIEYNFPNSHSTTTLEPINWKVKRYEDGSASFIAGNIEWVSRMGWSVEVRLKPETVYVEMESKLYNFTEFPQRFYYWVNAAVPVYSKTQFIYPPSVHRLYTHPPMDISCTAYVNYPIHRGRNISFFKNITQHFPVFAENMEEDFFGLYHHNLEVGLVHIADHSLVRGRKIWIFGNARDGKIWIDLLTDSGIDYCELQSGPFVLQSDYRMLTPGKIHLQREVWYPVVGLEGFNAASKELAANIKIEGNRVKVLINSTQKRGDLKVRLKTQQHTIAEKNISLVPLAMKSLIFTLPPKIKNEELGVSFLDESGNEILSYRYEQDKKLVENKGTNVDHDSKFLDTVYLQGRYLEEQGYPGKALEIYSKEAKTSLTAKISRARMIVASGKFKDAFAELEEVLSVDRENRNALYFSGICLEKLNRYKEAEKRFSHLMDGDALTEIALFHLAKISIAQKNYSRALSLLEKLMEFYPTNSHTLSLYALSLRKTHRLKEAKEVLVKAEKAFCFDPLTWGESFLLEKFYKKCNKKGAYLKILSSKSPQQIIEIVCRYIEIDHFEEALEVLNSYMKEREDTSLLPLVFYYRGYLEKKLEREKEARRSFVSGKSSQARWDFLFRLESETVLKRALESNPDDYTALYHLGNLLAFKGRWNEAVPCWKRVRGDNLSYALRAQGLFCWKVKGEGEKAIEKYKEALSMESCGVKTIWEYDHLCEELDYSEERLKALRKKAKMVYGDKRLLLRMASAFIASSYYKEALDILEVNKFPLCEGKALPRLLYEEACCALGNRYISKGDIKGALIYYKMPLQYPENLGVGKPSRNMEAEWWYRAGELLKEMGNIDEAKRFFQNGAKKGDGIDIEFFPLKDIVWEHQSDTIDIYYWINEFFRLLCLREIGESVQEKEILEKMDSFVDSKIAERRLNEPELQLIKALIFHGEGNNKKAIELLNFLPHNKSPYRRIRNFIIKHT